MIETRINYLDSAKVWMKMSRVVTKKYSDFQEKLEILLYEVQARKMRICMRVRFLKDY